MLDDTPPFRVSTDIISLSNVEDIAIVIQSDIGLDGELDFAFLLFSCLGLGVESVSECISPGWSKPEDNPSVRSNAMRSSYNVLKLFLNLILFALTWDLGSTSSHFYPA